MDWKLKMTIARDGGELNPAERRYKYPREQLEKQQTMIVRNRDKQVKLPEVTGHHTIHIMYELNSRTRKAA